MEEDNELPLKRVELSLSKFNEVAIPHHLDLLRQHKANIIKYSEAGELGRVRSEQVNARRVAARLRGLLAELEALRRRVRPADRARFDCLTRTSRDDTLRAVVDYLETPPMLVPGAGAGVQVEEGGGSVVSSESVGLVRDEPPQLQLQVDLQELEEREREAVLRGWSSLQSEVVALHSAWQEVQCAALAQRDYVLAAERSVTGAADCVQDARASLSAAEKLRGAALVAGGAAAGALAGGPVGLLVGAKAGAAAALAGSLLGALGVRLLGRRALPAPPPPPPPPPDTDQDKKAA